MVPALLPAPAPTIPDTLLSRRQLALRSPPGLRKNGASRSPLAVGRTSHGSTLSPTATPVRLQRRPSIGRSGRPRALRPPKPPVSSPPEPGRSVRLLRRICRCSTPRFCRSSIFFSLFCIFFALPLDLLTKQDYKRM